MIVTRKAAGIARPGIRNRSGSIGSDDAGIKVDEALTGDGPTDTAHAMRSVASRAGEAVADVPGMLAETGIGHDLVGIVALCAKGERSIHAEVRAGKEIGNELAGRRGLAEFVAALENVRPS